MTYSVKLDPDAEARMKALAEMRRLAPDAMLREAIGEYLDREEAQQAFRAEALASLSAFREDGLHVTLEETEAWLDSWGTDAETPPPVCH